MLMNGIKRFDTIESFENVIKEGLEKRIPRAKRISFQPVVKNNDRRLTGCVIEQTDSNISPTIYIDDLYKDIQSGLIEVDEAIERIAKAFNEHSELFKFDVKSFTEWERVKEHIVMRLVSRDRNSELLQDVPSIGIEGMDDLAVIFTFLTEISGEGQGTITIRNSHMEGWGVEVDALKAVAEENSPRLLPAVVQSMGDLLKEAGMMMPETEIGMTVITNEKKSYGAAAILYKGLLKDLAARMSAEELLLIPSSVHEILAISGRNVKISDVDAMVREVNESQVSPSERLGDHAYRYNAATDTISMQ